MQQRMIQRTLVMGLTIGAITPSAMSDGSGIWLLDVTTDNGDAIVEPGETAEVTLSMHMIANPGFNVVGLAATIFDTIGGQNAAKGHIVDWAVHNDFDTLTGDTTTTDGVSLFGTNAGQLTLFGPFTSDNPAAVLTFAWAPDVLGDYTVEYGTSTGALVVWEGESKSTAEAVDYDVVEGGIAFQVVPAPGALGVGVLGLGAIARRSRRGSVRGAGR